MSDETEKSYAAWVKRYILFHDKKHPSVMGSEEITAFLTHLAVDLKVAASTQNQTLASLLFLSRDVLNVDLPWLEDVVRAKRPQRVPVVLTRREIDKIFNRLDGQHWLLAALLDGYGLRLDEALRLRIKDFSFEYRQITVFDGKGRKDRVVPLPNIAA